MSDGFARQIEDASGMLFHAEDLLGQHEVMLTVSMDALLGLTARIIGLDRGILVEAWNRQDAALEAALIEEGGLGKPSAPCRGRNGCVASL